MIPARIYSWLAGSLLIVAVLFGIYAYGRADGREVQRKADAAEIDRKNAALRKAGAALSAAATRFREIDAIGATAAAESARNQAEAKAAGQAAAKDAKELQQRIDAINAVRDDSPCRDTRTGVRLQ